MKQKQIQQLFQQRYNQQRWKEFLAQTFTNARLYSTPDILLDINTDVATQALQLGNIKLNENGIERNIAVYDVTLASGIVLERNRVGLRNLLRKFWKDIDGAFIVFHRDGVPSWRFTYVSELKGFDAEGEWIEIKTEPKRYTYVLGELESCRTASERFALVAEKAGDTTLDDIKEAFSVEKLSKSFFEEYKRQYELFCEYMINQPSIFRSIFESDDKAVRDFTKKMLGRIVFLFFIQKKGWMGVPENEEWGSGDLDFLGKLFNICKHPELFYSEYLCKLFFSTLNTQRPNDIAEIVPGEKIRIPFLNGGLFEEDNPKFRNLIFPKDLFSDLFEFFNQYNFTIYEDDPNDQTVAVDPEILGHIFENLLEDNKNKGAFYTPKEIVHYMCQESLIEYLTTHFEGKGYEVTNYHASFDKQNQPELFPVNEGRKGQLTLEATATSNSKEIDRVLIEKLLKQKLDDADRELVLKHAHEFNKALDKVKICDPAIGSGAFPMGLLKEIFNAKQTLHTFKNGSTKYFDASSVKLNIIQNSIYGVDIEKGAVDIARLRFWLSLVVDEETPKALPNLDYKIVVGDSLVSKLGDDVMDIDWALNEVDNSLFGSDLVHQKLELLKEISIEQKEFFNPHSDKKKQAINIRNLKIDLLINQLGLMIKTANQETKPSSVNFGSNKKYVEATELYLESEGWKKQINKLQTLKTQPNKRLKFFDWKLDFPEVMNDQVVEEVGFDIIIGNPPYDVYQGRKKNEIAGILSFDIYQKCKGGKINAYELFLAKSDTLIKHKGINCQIFQNSFLADNSSIGVRKHYLETHSFIFIDSFPERDNIKKRVFESVKMSVCILLSKKINVQDFDFKLNVHSDRTFSNLYTVNLKKSEIIEFDKKNNTIPSLENEDKAIFLKYYKSKDSVDYLSYFECKEGELNMTFHKKYMISNKLYPLIVKGAQTLRYYITNTPSQGKVEYVDKESYLKDYGTTQKAHHHKKERIVLQGITGANDKIRLIGALINKNVFCANSCNYIIANIDNSSISIYSLLGLFNSTMTNWIFRKTSTNSNVNCYEVNNLKLPKKIILYNSKLEDIVKNILSRKINDKDTSNLEQQVNNIVYNLYDLTYDEVKVIDPEFLLSKEEYDNLEIE